MAEKDGKQDKITTINVLGLKWKTDTDQLLFSSQKQNTDIYTKREVVRVTSSLFDPLGLLSPVHVQAKIFIQKLWQPKLDWDDQMSEDLIKEWKAIKEELELANQTVIERQYFLESDNIPSNKTYELHVFADSSIKAYDAAVYLIHGEQSALVIAKSRVKPLKEITLPRLELLATFVAAHLLIFVKKALCALNIEKMVMWSDSQIVLYWTNSEKKLPLFVENPVKFVR